MISRIRKSIELPAGDRRIAARMTLGFVAAILCLMLVLAGASMGLTGSLAFSQPSPSGSGSPSGPAEPEGPLIQLLNPSAAYRPTTQQQEPPNPDPSVDNPTGNIDPPKISDKFDGTDEAYHVVAAVNDPPSSALIEVYFTRDGENEITVGEMTPVPGSPDTYELLWEVSDSIDAYFGVLTVRMYQDTPNGFEEVAADEEFVRLQQKEGQFIDEPPIAEAETVEMTWPSMNGPLGFYKGAGTGTVWRTVVHGLASPSLNPPPDPTNPNTDTPSTGADQVRVFYTTTPPGAEPEYTLCGQGGTSTGGPNGAETWALTCALAEDDVPSRVTALAAVAMQNHARQNNAARYSQESADVHRVQPYLQDPALMKVHVESQISGSFYTFRRRRAAGSDCLTYRVRVRDHLDRPVQGVNVDIHLRGPDDQIFFGHDATGTTGDNTSGHKNPDAKTGHSSEVAWDCGAGDFGSTQGDTNIPGANDVKHRESTLGSGLSGGGGVSFGEYRFGMYSNNVGLTDITAWVDDEPLTAESEKRPNDDDVLDEGEPRATDLAQWLAGSISVSIDPAGATAATGSCTTYIVKVRDGTRPVPDANVDVHATGPSNELDFCDPGEDAGRSAPNQGTGHSAEDAGEASHTGQPPVAQHTEGVTNGVGNFVVGLTSPDAGDTTITAWYDGEETFDNDDFGTEASATATTNWIQSTGDAAISFLNPSPYGAAGTNVGKKQDVDSAYHIVTRVSSLTDVPGVELFYKSGSNPLVKIADATRVGQTDAWEAYWPVDVADGSYTLVARIRDTGITAEQAVTVRNQGSMVDPTVVPFETVEITAPLDGQRASFTNRRLPVRGVASAGAEGVTLYYTKASALTTPASGAWTSCGTATLPSGTAPKEFTLDCTLTGSDQPGLVSGIAALAYNCLQDCRASQTNHSGDAHRVFGAEAAPLLSMEPAETAADVDECVKFVVSLFDQTGQPIPGQNVDVHMTGPGNSGNFCAPEDGSGTPRRAPNDGGHVPDANETDEAYHDDPAGQVRHTEAETTANGRLIFAIESATAGDTQLTVWLDENDNDSEDQGERSDVSIMHWETESACDITGTDGPDVLEGSDASEKICGFGGDDVIRGAGGDDVIGGGAGNDLLRGNAGNDSVRGGAGNDRVFGGGGTDSVFGGGGTDVVAGHRSNDRLRGNRGNDRLNGGPGRDDCRGGAGRDRLQKCEAGTRSFAARTRPI